MLRPCQIVQFLACRPLRGSLAEQACHGRRQILLVERTLDNVRIGACIEAAPAVLVFVT